jgi:hypothetical protein
VSTPDAILLPMQNTRRIADLRVSGLTIWFVRYVYPLVMLYALVQRRRNQKAAAHAAAELGSSVARVVVASHEGAKTMRKLTYVIAIATIISTAFVVYSALK